MRELIRPSHQIVVWDGGLAAERLSLLPEYKAQRDAMPSDLESQLDEITSYLQTANVTSWCDTGIEADDMIATVAKCALKSDLDVVIASSDKDFMQLVGSRVFLLNPNDKSEALWDEARVREKTGVIPSQIVDWLSLIGDSVDNISGVVGVGPKTASELLSRFGSVEEVYRRLSEINSERLRANLEKARAQVTRNQSLILLRSELTCDFNLEKFRVKESDPCALRALYEGWGFRGMIKSLDENQSAQTNLFE